MIVLIDTTRFVQFLHLVQLTNLHNKVRLDHRPGVLSGERGGGVAIVYVVCDQPTRYAPALTLRTFPKFYADAYYSAIGFRGFGFASVFLSQKRLYLHVAVFFVLAASRCRTSRIRNRCRVR